MSALDKAGASKAASQATSVQSVPSTSQYTSLVMVAKANITSAFLDGQSVQWRNLYISDSSSRPILCGELNAKNSYGAYVGFRRFFAAAELGVQAIDTEKQPNTLTAMWDSACRRELEKVE